MAELEIDQSNLPRVQEVCQGFAVLEDGVLAHNLQEQEIEQYYSTNVQKSQLVQNDIRVAKKLQDEEETQWAQQRAVRQTSRQLTEEQDFELARVIQDEMQRNAEEARRRRELDDQEVAKRLQEEEEQRMRVRRRGQNGHREGEEQYPNNAARWQYSTSDFQSDSNGTLSVWPSEVAAQENRASRSNQGHEHSFHHSRQESRESLSQDSDSDTVFRDQLSSWSQRWDRRVHTAPCRPQASRRGSQEARGRRSPRSSFTDEMVIYEEERGREEEDSESDHHDTDPHHRDKRRWRRREDNHDEEDIRLRHEDRDSRWVHGRERHLSRTESVRLHDRNGHRNGDLVRTWSYKDQDKHVHFQDNTRRSSRRSDESRQVWEMLGQVLMERGVPVKIGGDRAPLQIRPQRRDSQVLHGSEVSCCSSTEHHRDFQRAAPTRHSFHGDVRKRRKPSQRENSGRDHREGRDGRRDEERREEELQQISSRNSFHLSRERQGSRRWREQRFSFGEEQGEDHHRVRRTTSHLGQKTPGERFMSEEEVQRRSQWPPGRTQQLSQHQRSSRDWTRAGSRQVWTENTRDGGPAPSAGLPLQQDRPAEDGLHLGELQQVLEDEELARKLQEEEEKLMKKNFSSSPRSSYPEGDFRAAQVAQDEEIARFMQNQELKLKPRPCELEGPSSWREHRAMITDHDRRAARERQRERLDSEGLPSPTEDWSPENQPPSPGSTSLQTQNIRNIAEELDPTFQGRRQDTNQLPLEATGPTGQLASVSPLGLKDIPVEPAFIPPTKRQTEKPARSKTKEKKENCKQQ